MKKLLLIQLIVAWLGMVPTTAQAQQTLIVNGESVEKVVARLSFRGDNVVLTFADQTTQEIDMNAVSLSFDLLTQVKAIETFRLKKTVDSQLDLTALPQGTEVTIFDATGKQVMRTKAGIINVSALRTGIYAMKAGNCIVKFSKR